MVRLVRCNKDVPGIYGGAGYPNRRRGEEVARQMRLDQPKFQEEVRVAMENRLGRSNSPVERPANSVNWVFVFDNEVHEFMAGGRRGEDGNGVYGDLGGYFGNSDSGPHWGDGPGEGT